MVILPFITNLWTDYLWFQDLGYESVFITTLVAKISTGIITFFTVFLLSYLVFRLTLKFKSNKNTSGTDNVIELNVMSTDNKNKITIILALMISLFLSLMTVTTLWERVLLFLNQTSFGVMDPVFNRDLSFYFFTLPIMESAFALAMVLLFGLAILTFVFSFYKQSLGTDPVKAVVKKLSYFIMAFFLLLIVGFQLRIINLLYSSRGAAYGASFTDINVAIPYFHIASLVSLIAAITLFIGMKKNNWRITFLGPILLIVVLVGGTVTQGLVQSFIVNPNEVNRELEYISRNIEMTKTSYELDKITEVEYPVYNNLSFSDIEAASETINNIRINDYRPALTIFNQLQGMRLYYRFTDVDIDRYEINGQITQVFIAPRELDQALLPEQAQTWINRYLKYTHGYGAVVAPVNQITSQGQPSMIVRDIPPVTQHPELQITRPEIYFGELTNDYVIVHTEEKEFDYPLGEANAETVYEGTGGVSLSGINRVLMALDKGNFRILFSSAITGESKILMHRNIKERVEKIAPFFTYDNDPYLVIDEGRLYWIIDAYTLSNKYPYAQPIRLPNRTENANYIRNPVKVTIDAYTGEVAYYLVDETDPVANTYANIFPGLLKPISQMPLGLQKHIRYPVDLFEIQTSIFQHYHMSNPRVFYNREDAWSIATELYRNASQVMQPYYVNMSLPSSDEIEYLLMRPFTPVGRNNMVGWLAARNDMGNYGELVLYRFPKQELIYGPMQIESRISADADISRDISLWDQRGSNVIRGNLMVIPINNSILYIEPVYIEADGGEGLPEVRRIIAAYQDMIVMEETLEEALYQLFIGIARETSEDDEDQVPIDFSINVLARQAKEAFERAQSFSRAGDWSQYGEALKDLERLINELENSINATNTSQVD